MIASMFVFGCAPSSSDGDDAESSDQHLTGAANPTLANACGGGAWLSTETYDGLKGSYARIDPAPAGGLVSIAFTNVVPGVGPRVDGDYSRTLEGGATSSGTFEGLADNPAFESNFMLTPTGGGMPDMYYALAIKRSANGDISDLCIVHPVGPAEAPIVLRRAVTAPPAGDAPPSP